MPHIQLSTFKRELDHLVKLGILVSQHKSEWARPSFITPKKDGSVHWISNLCQLNEVVKQKQYPLPILTDILRRHIGYSF